MRLNRRILTFIEDDTIPPSTFGEWHFFDTNCLSELAKQWTRGNANNVSRFMSGRKVLLVSSVLQELRKAPDVLLTLDQVFLGHSVFLLPDTTNYWYTDIANFLNVQHLPINPLELHPLPHGFLTGLIHHVEFEKACVEAEENVKSRFMQKVSPDIGSSLDERDLCIHIWSVVNKRGQEWFNINIPTIDCTPGNFPSFYVYFYAYYFKYIKNGTAKIELNDFVDLENCIVAPYCKTFYSETKLANVLRLNVQEHTPPTSFQLSKRLFRKNLISTHQYRSIKANRVKFDRTSELLPRTRIYNFGELLEEIDNTLPH